MTLVYISSDLVFGGYFLESLFLSGNLFFNCFTQMGLKVTDAKICTEHVRKYMLHVYIKCWRIKFEVSPLVSITHTCESTYTQSNGECGMSYFMFISLWPGVWYILQCEWFIVWCANATKSKFFQNTLLQASEVSELTYMYVTLYIVVVSKGWFFWSYSILCFSMYAAHTT